MDGVNIDTPYIYIRYDGRYTPWLRNIKTNNSLQNYGVPGQMVTFGGRFFTKDYGNLNIGEEEFGTVTFNEQHYLYSIYLDTGDPLSDEEPEDKYSITGVIMGERECVPADELGNVYGIELNKTSGEGTISCIPAGTYIGPMNARVYISGKYGKTLPSSTDDLLAINSKGQMFHYHTLPEVTSVTPNTGSTLGGTHIKIQGNSFDAYPGKTQVQIGSKECKVISITNTELVCIAPTQADVLLGDNRLGPRGVKQEIWSNTEADPDMLETTAEDYSVMEVENFSISGPLPNEHFIQTNSLK